MWESFLHLDTPKNSPHIHERIMILKATTACADIRVTAGSVGISPKSLRHEDIPRPG